MRDGVVCCALVCSRNITPLPGILRSNKHEQLSWNFLQTSVPRLSTPDDTVYSISPHHPAPPIDLHCERTIWGTSQVGLSYERTAILAVVTSGDTSNYQQTWVSVLEFTSAGRVCVFRCQPIRHRKIAASSNIIGHNNYEERQMLV